MKHTIEAYPPETLSHVQFPGSHVPRLAHTQRRVRPPHPLSSESDHYKSFEDCCQRSTQPTSAKHERTCSSLTMVMGCAVGFVERGLLVVVQMRVAQRSR